MALSKQDGCRLQGLRREGIGTFKARTALGWQPTEVGNLQRLQGLRREGIGTSKAGTAVGWQPRGYRD